MTDLFSNYAESDDSSFANEPTTSAVTTNWKAVSYWNQAERMAPFSALRNNWKPLLHPYRTHDLCPVNFCPALVGDLRLLEPAVHQCLRADFTCFNVGTGPRRMTGSGAY